MRNCENCEIILDDNVRFCPNCGNAVAGSSATSEDRDVRLAALLTSANLHRVKREWDAAVADATEALRIAPDRAEVASLLANIYEQRGNLEEAAIWYRIALDLDPQRSVDRIRLENVVRRISGNTSTSKSGRKEPIVAGLVSLVVTLVAVILFLNLRAPTHQKTNERAVKQPERAPIRNVTDNVSRPTSETKQPVSTTPLAGNYGQSPALRTAAEIAIREAASRVPLAQYVGSKVDDVIADPRGGTVVITFSIPFKAMLKKADIASVAAAVARAAFAQNAEVQNVTARCVVSVGGSGGAMILFVGDTNRSTLMSLPEKATGQQAETAFTNTWWNPQIGGSE